MAFCAKISPNIVTRVIESCREVLNHVLPDVYINTDHYKGSEYATVVDYVVMLLTMQCVVVQSYGVFVFQTIRYNDKGTITYTI